ncbi:MAG TPA: hypothetical protein VD862_01615 [Candidatus Paceibacterota bacterium]|nr:hypothetical protein [Candidatus Paceibacterota bacterium]
MLTFLLVVFAVIGVVHLILDAFLVYLYFRIKREIQLRNAERAEENAEREREHAEWKRRHEAVMALFDELRQAQDRERELQRGGIFDGPDMTACRIWMADILTRYLAVEEDDYYRRWLNELSERLTGDGKAGN